MPRVRVILVAAALGVVTSIVGAWALAAWMPFNSYPRQTAHYFVANALPWSAAVRASRGVHSIWWDEIDVDSYTAPGQPASTSRWPSTPETWVAYARASHEASLRFVRRHSAPRIPDVSVRRPMWGTFAGGRTTDGVRAGQDCAFGWPFPALWYQVPGTIAANTATATGIRGGVMLTPRSTLDIRGYDFRALPMRPIWWGLAANSLLFGSAWWLLITGPPAARRVLRARAGRCPECGYALGGLPPGSLCPECGGHDVTAAADPCAPP